MATSFNPYERYEKEGRKIIERYFYQRNRLETVEEQVVSGLLRAGRLDSTKMYRLLK